METENSIQLKEESIYPDFPVLADVLGNSFPAFEAMLELFKTNELTYEWRYYRDGKAWLCKVQQKKRTIVWISVWNGFLKATLYFPQKHREKIFDLDLPEERKENIRMTKDVGKSKPCTFEIRREADLADFEKVMLLKIACK